MQAGLCPGAPPYRTEQSWSSRRHFPSSGTQGDRPRNGSNRSQPPIRLNAGLLTLSVEAVMRDADVDKSLQDLRINSPKLESKRRFVSSGPSGL